MIGQIVFDPLLPWPLLWLAAAVCGIAFLWLEAIVLGFVDEKTLERLHWLQSRYVYSPLYVVNAAAFGYLVIWLATLPGRPSASRVAAPLRLLGRVLRAGLTWAPLRLAGRHALPVFCFHVLLAYVVVVVDQTIGPFADATEIAILLACLASMLGVAALSEARDRRSAERRPATAAMRGPGVRA